MVYFKVIILFITLALITAKKINFRACEYPTDEMRPVTGCSIYSIRLSPCSLSVNDHVCDVAKESNISVIIEYSTSVSGYMVGNLYRVSNDQESALLFSPSICGIPLAGFDTTKICNHLSGLLVSTNLDWNVPNSIAEGETIMKVRLWNEDRKGECCAEFDMNVTPCRENCS